MAVELARDAGATGRQATSAEVPFVADIDGGQRAHAQQGGKAAWLDELVHAGFPVPRSLVITTRAYDAVVADPDLARTLDELGRRDPHPHHAAEEQAEIDQAFLSVRLPDPVRAAIDEAGARLVGDGPDLMAVRSSATAEDLHGTSFAGQYQSFLEVDRAGLERAVRLVWASLWHPAPRWYRRYNGIDERHIGMGVILMPMVEPDLAGVAFSEDPGGRPDTLRIEVVHGLGEQLVSGAVTPGVHLVPRHAPAGAAHREVERVAELLIAIEDAFGEPQDIEWAILDGEVHVLQARPITTIAHRGGDGFDSPTPETTTWTTAGIAEMLPGPLPPLVWDINRRLVEEAFRELFGMLATLPDDADERGSFVGRFRGRAALNLDLMKAAAGEASDDEIERQYFGTRPASAPPPRQPWFGRLLAWGHHRRLLHVQHLATVGAESAVSATAELVVLRPDPSALEHAALLGYHTRLMDLGGRAMTSEVAVASSASAASRRLELWLAKHFDAAEAARRALALTAPVDGREAIAATDPDRCRAVFAGPTWGEGTAAGAPASAPPNASPDTELTASAGVATEDQRDDPWNDVIEALRATPGWSSTRVLTGQVIDVRLAVLRGLVEDATALLDLRERSKHALFRLGGEVRRVHLELGRRMVANGLLDQATDVDFLSERELIGSARIPTRAEISRRRRWLEDDATDDPLPVRFTGAPAHHRAHAATGSVLHGWAASAGRCRGRAVVLHDPDSRGLERGDILVTRTTDASWAPAFTLAGAIVVEEGGPLSHAAIVARELGIPAVVNVPGVVDRLDGLADTEITVDGNDGLVTIHPRASVGPEVQP